MHSTSVAPIAHGPFYAVKIVPGSLGTFAGLKTDAQANVLDAQSRPIAGLFAVGADMASIMGGTYPAPGITIGPRMQTWPTSPSGRWLPSSSMAQWVLPSAWM